jgi:hypothetical protein
VPRWLRGIGKLVVRVLRQFRFFMRVTGGARLWNPGKLGKELPAVMGNR